MDKGLIEIDSPEWLDLFLEELTKAQEQYDKNPEKEKKNNEKTDNNVRPVR